MPHADVKDIAQRLSRSAYNARALVANPTAVAHHQLELLTFQHAYKWFPTARSTSRSAAFEIDPRQLAKGYAALHDRRVQQQRDRKTLVRRVGMTPEVAAGEKAATVPDVRSHWYVQRSVTELIHQPDSVVANLGTKVINPAAVLEMGRPRASATAPHPFDRCYTAAMQYYQELLTKMFHRPVYLVSSWNSEFGVWDASFVAYFLRHYIEENISLSDCLKQLEANLGHGNWVRPVRHFDETAHYIVRAWRVFLKGRFHTSPIGRKENSRSIIKGQVPVFQPHKYVDYFQTTAQTTQGVVGIKVWLWLDVPK
jgi:hypothetical protein